MKKFTIIAFALCMAFALAAPAMAVDANFSGYYWARGVTVSHWDLDDRTNDNAFMQMKFRLQTVFKVSDILSVTTRFDALDKKTFGGSVDPTITFDRAYMTIKTDIGTFALGRMGGGTWGTSYLDSAGDVDRIKYTKVMDDLTLYITYQKDTEADATAPAAGTSDEDKATYYLGGKYKMENVTSGLLLSFTNDRTAGNITTKTFGAVPYFVGKFGPLNIQGELAYKWGDVDYNDAGTTDADIKKLAYNIEASFNLGAATVLAGYAFTSGDNTSDNEVSGYGGVGGDWEKLFILTTDEVPSLINLGNLGNVSSKGITNMTLDPGAKIIYAGVVVAPAENVSLMFAAGSAEADKAPVGYKASYGVEYDLTLNWKIYDNLTYTAIAAYLDAGDIFWQGVATEPANFSDTYALFHQLILKF